METITIVFGILLWIAVGLWGFIYWWNTEYDLEISTLLLGLLMSSIGPGTWLMGWMIHSPSNAYKPRILIKKRKNIAMSNCCKDYNEECYNIENKQYCYNLCPEEGYCPFLKDEEEIIEYLKDDLFKI